ncbi:OCIA domain-containing protein 1 isoform X1 [Hylaeus anthracinus]|uniref:OCIA domain-containing protein 1 isoform X1 n=1 Tax=Hylaeus anthracinus TaxID=313031 RepID=UPI0023BA20EE|nr:OCIA domain-containing protein 1 isoform X1 [Hylaeus anthracinus]XP_054012567.1 OCIA domain-containing protein 1 isoform X1 [Hylaeus anthracinus]
MSNYVPNEMEQEGKYAGDLSVADPASSSRNMSFQQMQGMTERITETFQRLPPETREAYKKCMESDAIYKSALPYGLTAAGVSYVVSSTLKFGQVGHVITAIMGLVGYTLGRVKYSVVCLEKHAPSIFQMITREKFSQKGGMSHDSFDQESVLSESFGNSKENALAWNTYDTSGNSSEFVTTSNDLGEELSTDVPINLKPHTTYEDLRRQNRAEYYKKYHGHGPTQRDRPVQDIELLEDTTFQSETRDTIWS